MTVGVDYDVDEIRIVKRRSGQVVTLVGEAPRRRPRLPEVPTERPAIVLKTGAPALGVEIPLVPQACFAFRRSSGLLACRHGVLNGVAANQHRRPEPVG